MKPKLIPFASNIRNEFQIFIDELRMDPEEVKAFYEKKDVVIHYAVAVNRVGLWQSEELLLTRVFNTDQKLLELGCGAGRISVGLAELGYTSLVATDYSEEMVDMARYVMEDKNLEVPLLVADACELPFEDESFEGAIFGFNGLMQIPHSSRRLQALHEIARVLKPGSKFFFTTHDRENPKHRKEWNKDRKKWVAGLQHEGCDEFGDRIGDTEWGEMYIHIPIREEIEAKLEIAGFRLVTCKKRSELAHEDRATREFSDECLMWVVAKK